MQSYRFPVMGFERSYWDFLIEEGRADDQRTDVRHRGGGVAVWPL
jgi:hypothetical protein